MARNKSVAISVSKVKNTFADSCKGGRDGGSDGRKDGPVNWSDFKHSRGERHGSERMDGQMTRKGVASPVSARIWRTATRLSWRAYKRVVLLTIPSCRFATSALQNQRLVKS